MFGTSTLKFTEMQKIAKKKKKENNFWTKNALFEYFRL